MLGRMPLRRCLLFLVLCGLFSLTHIAPGTDAKGSANSSPKDASAAWNALAEEFFDQGYYRFLPSAGTSDGFHQYDSRLEDYSRSGIDAQIQALHQFEKRFAAVDVTPLDRTQAADRDLILSDIRSRLLGLEVIRPWEKNPDVYSSGITSSVYSIMERHFDSPDKRLASVVAREKQMPAVLAAARQNLKNPPRIFSEIALEQLPGNISIFERDLPAAFADATDPSLKAEFAQSNAAVLAALRGYQSWLRSEVLPQSHGDFRLGATTFTKKLLFDEMVDVPLDRLLAVATADLRKNQAEFERVAKGVDASKTPRQVLDELTKDHPTAAQVLPAFRNTFDGLISFIQKEHILTIPSGAPPVLQETPPFMRATTFASMDAPGVFETGHKEAFFNVTLPGPHDSAQQIEERLGSFNRGTILSTAIHEAYPGHYVQFLWLPYAPSKARKILGANTNIEGWAHYCEQMMLDEGYGQPGRGAKDVREAGLIRLGQLQDALLRDARFVVGIEMHTGKMTFEQGIAFFVREGYQTHETGLTETKRGTSDPTYLYYTLGKLEILKLRADVQRKQGTAFSLQRFHDDFLKQGVPPIKIVRQALLGDDSPAL